MRKANKNEPDTWLIEVDIVELNCRVRAEGPLSPKDQVPLAAVSVFLPRAVNAQHDGQVSMAWWGHPISSPCTSWIGRVPPLGP